MLKCIGVKRLRINTPMRRPRKLKASRERWFEENRASLMHRYIRTVSPLMWMAWLAAEYEEYRND